MLYTITFFIFLSYYDFDEYTLVLVLNKMLKRMGSVTKKLFGGKSRAGTLDTLFQGCSTASSRWVEMMKHVDPSLVGGPTCSQRDEIIFLFSYHFPIWIYWLLYIPFFRTRRASGGRRRWRLRGWRRT
jgi:hypothetical protein